MKKTLIASLLALASISMLTACGESPEQADFNESLSNLHTATRAMEAANRGDTQSYQDLTNRLHYRRSH